VGHGVIDKNFSKPYKGNNTLGSNNEILKMDDSKTQNRNPKYQIGRTGKDFRSFVQFDISDFGFEFCYRPFSKFHCLSLIGRPS
jgi:hypothetical protein